MRLQSLTIEGFGTWQRVHLADLSANLTVFYGPNEAGKSTLLEFVRGMLYGFTPEQLAQQLAAHAAESPGGSLRAIDDGEQSITISRRLNRAAGPLPSLHVTGTQGAGGDALLADVLCGIDEATYRQVFAVGLDEMQHLAVLSDLEAAKFLYDLSLGVSGISLSQAAGELKAVRDRVLDPGGGPSELQRLGESIVRTEDEISRLPTLGRDWADALQQKEVIDAELEQLESSRGRWMAESERLQAAHSICEPWQRRADINRQLAEGDGGMDLPAGAAERFAALGRTIAARKRLRLRLEERLGSVRREEEAVALRPGLRRLGSRIEAFQLQYDWLVSIERRLADDARAEAGAGDEPRKPSPAGGPGDVSPETVARARRVAATLRDPARELRAAREALEVAEQKEQRLADELKQMDAELRNKLAGSPQGDLPEAVKKAAERATALRRRLVVAERMDEMSRQRGELNDQVQHLLERQMLPLGALAGIGGMFVLGVAMVMAAIWMPQSVVGSLGRGLMAVGILGSGSAAALKFLVERSATRRLADCRRQLALLDRELVETKKQRDDLDRLIPAGGGPLTSRLQAAERALESLERLLPLDAGKQTARRELEAARQSSQEARRRAETALASWRRSMQSAGLPEDWTPQKLMETARLGRRHDSRQRERFSLQLEAQSRQREYDSIQTRVRRLAEDAGIVAEAATASELLRRLASEWADEAPRWKQRAKLRRQIRSLSTKKSRTSRQLRRLIHRRRQLLSLAGAGNAAEFRQIAQRQSHRQQLLAERQRLDRQISSAAQLAGGTEILEQILACQSTGGLLAEKDALHGRIENAAEKIHALREQRAALGQRLEGLAGDPSLARRRLELAELSARCDSLVDRWLVQQAACRLLARLGERYERDRQPETLVQASAHLEQLTEGRYRRVWTPLDRRVLLVDDRGGHTKSVEQLSRGTREQLFLALRLALVALYSRRGVRLPVVLDDVLVNFDRERTTAAARLLIGFAEAGHQVLLFTCHRHICGLFKSQGTVVRSLPGRPKRRGMRHRKAVLAPVRSVEAEPMFPLELTASAPIVLDEDEGPSSEEEPTMVLAGFMPQWDESVSEQPAEPPAIQWDVLDANDALVEEANALTAEIPPDIGTIPHEIVAADTPPPALERWVETVMDLPERPVAAALEVALPRPHLEPEPPEPVEIIDDEWVRIGTRVRRRDMLPGPTRTSRKSEPTARGRASRGASAA